MNALDHAFLREEEEVAKYKKKRARQLQHDKFRDTTMNYVDRATHKLEGSGRKFLYGLGALVLIGLIVWGVMAWTGSRNDQASLALGRAIKTTQAPIVATPVPGSNEPSFKTEKERAQKAVEEFQKVAASYGGSTGEYARYLAATNQVKIDRDKGIAELDALTKSSNKDIAVLSKFALAQAKEAAGKLEEAAPLYSDIAKLNNDIITPETANLSLALVYEKIPNKKQEAVDILFNLVEASRKAKDKNGKPVTQSAAARKAATELEKLDAARYAQLSPPPLPENFALR
jgi:tetratricopeptide (TPR) repeat protein